MGLPFTKRADVIFVDKDKALVVEAKGWRRVKKIGDNAVEADGELHKDPSYQLNNYVSKFNLFHSSNIKFEGVLFLYNTVDYSSTDCKILGGKARGFPRDVFPIQSSWHYASLFFDVK